MDALCNHLEILGWYQQLSDLHRLTIYVSGSLEQTTEGTCFCGILSFQLSEMDRWELMSFIQKNSLETSVGWVNEKLHSIASYFRPGNSIRSAILLQ